MAQHFLLSAKARTLSLRSVYRNGEDKAYETFCRMRWAEMREPICPRCGGPDPYSISRPPQVRMPRLRPSIQRHKRHDLCQPENEVR